MQRTSTILILIAFSSAFSLALVTTWQISSPSRVVAQEATPTREKLKERDNPNRRALPVHPSDAIEAKLAKPDSFTFQDESLKNVVDNLSGRLDVPFVLDKSALEDAGVNSDEPISCELKGIRLDTCLDLILGELELTWVVRDGYVFVTTPDKLGSLQEIRVFNCSDLLISVQNKLPVGSGFGGMGSAFGSMGGGMVEGGMGGMSSTSGGVAGGLGTPEGMPGMGMPGGMGMSGGGMGMSGMGMGSPAKPSQPEVVDFDSLIEVITTTIEPETWDDTGGVGTIMAYQGGLLVVKQDGRAQRRIAFLLDMMRKAKQAQAGTMVRER